mmetsp:Transcript_3706/g.13640  ORF Transcript_3706/g.13640 Transcript_3706/m.13640 type:complete len:259 (-) Transcript_3706:6788-7564(-)
MCASGVVVGVARRRADPQQHGSVGLVNVVVDGRQRDELRRGPVTLSEGERVGGQRDVGDDVDDEVDADVDDDSVLRLAAQDDIHVALGALSKGRHRVQQHAGRIHEVHRPVVVVLERHHQVSGVGVVLGVAAGGRRRELKIDVGLVDVIVVGGDGHDLRRHPVDRRERHRRRAKRERRVHARHSRGLQRDDNVCLRLRVERDAHVGRACLAQRKVASSQAVGQQQQPRHVVVDVRDADGVRHSLVLSVSTCRHQIDDK